MTPQVVFLALRYRLMSLRERCIDAMSSFNLELDKSFDWQIFFMDAKLQADLFEPMTRGESCMMALDSRFEAAWLSIQHLL